MVTEWVTSDEERSEHPRAGVNSPTDSFATQWPRWRCFSAEQTQSCADEGSKGAVRNTGPAAARMWKVPSDKVTLSTKSLTLSAPSSRCAPWCKFTSFTCCFYSKHKMFPLELNHYNTTSLAIICRVNLYIYMVSFTLALILLLGEVFYNKVYLIFKGRSLQFQSAQNFTRHHGNLFFPPSFKYIALVLFLLANCWGIRGINHSMKWRYRKIINSTIPVYLLALVISRAWRNVWNVLQPKTLRSWHITHHMSRKINNKFHSTVWPTGSDEAEELFPATFGKRFSAPIWQSRLLGLPGLVFDGCENGGIESLLQVLLRQSRALHVLRGPDLLGQAPSTRTQHRFHLVTVQVNQNVDVQQEVRLSPDQDDGRRRVARANLRDPFLRDVLEGRRVDDAEAKQEDVRVCVGQRAEAVKLLLKRRDKNSNCSTLQRRDVMTCFWEALSWRVSQWKGFKGIIKIIHRQTHVT